MSEKVVIQRVVTTEKSSLVRDTEAIQRVVSGGSQGPSGRQGPPGIAGGSSFERVSGGPMSALVVTWEDEDGVVSPLDYRDQYHIDMLAGITVTAASSAGSSVIIQRSGPLDANGLGLMPGRVWLGANGALTQNPPDDGFDVLVGYATRDNRIYMDITDSISLEV